MANAETVLLDRHLYDDPFLDMASLKLPKTFKKLLELCHIFAVTHPQISPIVWRLAEYPITGLMFEGDKEAVKQKKELYENKLKMMEKTVEWGIDYYGYGNCFVTISFPFIRFYKCRTCGYMHEAKRLAYKYRGGVFEGKCKKCKTDRKYDAVDKYIKAKDKINIFRLEPMQMHLKYNPVTGEYFYEYDIPSSLRKMVNSGDRDIIDTTPVGYLRCIKLKRRMRLERVFHFKRPTISGRDMEWGFPLIMPALRDAYLNQILKKAEEQIALEHSVPLRFLYPQPSSQDPLRTISMSTFRKFMERNIKYWRKDKNAIITSPIPIAHTMLGGDANAYSTINQRVKIVDEIIGAMMVTKGFVMGGEAWSSASISQRILENTFLSYLRRLDACLQWVDNEVSAFLDMPPCKVKMKPFKKIDDVQQLQVLINLAHDKKVSWDEVMSRMDINYMDQMERIRTETEEQVGIMIQEMVGQASGASEAAAVQVQGQIEQQNFGQMIQKQHAHSQGVAAEVTGTGTEAQAHAGVQQNIQMGQQLQQAAAQTQIQGAQALNERRSAAAQKDMSKAQADNQKANVQQIQMNEQVNRSAMELLGLPLEERKDMMQRMMQSTPQFAEAVFARADQIEQQQGDGGQAMAQQAQQGRAAQLVAELQQNAKNPEEFANRLKMQPPQARLEIFSHLRSTNPDFFLEIGKFMTGRGRSQKSPKDTVNMKPLPEQSPPTRTDKPV